MMEEIQHEVSYGICSPLHYLYHLCPGITSSFFFLEKLHLSTTLHFSVTPENTNMHH